MNHTFSKISIRNYCYLIDFKPLNHSSSAIREIGIQYSNESNSQISVDVTMINELILSH